MNHKVFLSRRNILSLLSKLDRAKAGEDTQATLIKCDNQHIKYPQTMEECRVTAVEFDAPPGKKYTSSQIYLNRRDLTESLLAGFTTMLQLTDGQKLTDDTLTVAKVEDEEYYASRTPGEVYWKDDPRNKR